MKITGLNIIRSGKTLYKDFGIEFEKEKVTCILAPSGSGKTTLLDWISGTLDINRYDCHGKIEFAGKGKISYIFQEPRLLANLTVFQNVALPLKNEMDASKASERTKLYLDKAGLSEKTSARPNRLSGGERQRVNIARAFAYPSDILLMDEPFQSQDLLIKHRLMDTVKNLIDTESRTVVFVTHDIDEAVFLADRIVFMKGTPLEIILDENASSVDRKRLEHTIVAG